VSDLSEKLTGPVPETLDGALAEGVIPGVLREAYVGRRSGVLHFTRGEERRSIRFLCGNVVDDGSSGDAREALLEVLGWEGGNYSFEAREWDPPGGAVVLRHPTSELILEAVRGVRGPGALERALGDQDRALMLSTDPLLRFQRTGLTSTDGYILSRVDGTLTAKEVLAVTPLPAEEVHRSLLGLLCTGIVEYIPPRPRPLASPAAARTALTDESTQRTLREAPLPSGPVVKDALEAAQALDDAEQRIGEGKHWEAVGLIEHVLPAVAGGLQRRARVLLAKAYLKSPDWTRQAEEQLRIVLHDEPDNVDASLLLGVFYRNRGLKNRAATMFRKVVSLEPGHARALAELQSLEQEDENPATRSAKGLLFKLFGRGVPAR
jgi:tetratricopeptide (TPR) repeat protein